MISIKVTERGYKEEEIDENIKYAVSKEKDHLH